MELVSFSFVFALVICKSSNFSLIKPYHRDLGIGVVSSIVFWISFPWDFSICIISLNVVFLYWTILLNCIG